MFGTRKALYGNTIASDFVGYGKRKFKGIQRWKFLYRASRGYKKADKLLKASLKRKECYFGPFKGEFGHFLGHNLPLISFLHEKGVKIHYCGLKLHQPLLVNESGDSLIHEFHELRDFFAEVEPTTNETMAPPDVEGQIEAFRSKARESGLPFWDLSDGFWYWFCFRTWIFTTPVHRRYDLSKIYGTTTENSAVIFPRKKGTGDTTNNGQPWNYQEVAESVSPYFDKVYICGHPALSHELEAKGNIELVLTDDNRKILTCCANSKVIINQHSGTVYLGAYTGARVLILFQPKRKIVGMEDTLIFNAFLKPRFGFDFAWGEQELKLYCEMLSRGEEPSGNPAFSYPF